MHAEGAYRRAIGVLTTQVSQHTDEEQRRWASVLSPTSSRSDEALHGQSASASGEVPAATPDDNAGVRYAALTAPGPTGTRPKHAKEAFGIRQKPVAQRLARAMLKVRRSCIGVIH